MARTVQKVRAENAGKAAAKTPSRAAIAAKAPKKSIAKPAKVTAAKKAEDAEVKERKPHKWRPGTVALRQIRKLQQSTENIFPAAAMKRLIKEIAQDNCTKSDGVLKAVRMSPTAIAMLQMVAEDVLDELMKDSLKNMVHGRRKTLMIADFMRALSSHNNFTHTFLKYDLRDSEDPGQALVRAAVREAASSSRKKNRAAASSGAVVAAKAKKAAGKGKKKAAEAKVDEAAADAEENNAEEPAVQDSVEIPEPNAEAEPAVEPESF